MNALAPQSMSILPFPNRGGSDTEAGCRKCPERAGGVLKRRTAWVKNFNAMLALGLGLGRWNGNSQVVANPQRDRLLEP